MLKKRRLSQNEEAIRGILLIIVFIVGLVFLRDILVKRGVRILMLTREDYMNAVEYLVLCQDLVQIKMRGSTG